MLLGTNFDTVCWRNFWRLVAHEWDHSNVANVYSIIDFNFGLVVYDNY